MRLSDFDYNLPEELIAQEPIERRDMSRLFVLHRHTATFEHRMFKDIKQYLQPGDVLVINETRVLPARLFGWREETGSVIEMLLLEKVEGVKGEVWEVLVKPGKKARVGSTVVFGDGELKAIVLDSTPDGGRIVEFTSVGSFKEAISSLGRMPVPPYVKKELQEPERYQTVYARQEGSSAAPTAGLHFTPELLAEIRDIGVQIVPVLLHVGLGTFRPVNVENVEEHVMHREYYEISEEAAKTINAAKSEGRRIIAVGTTSVRTLETAAQEMLKSVNSVKVKAQKVWIKASQGWSQIFIYPGFPFQVIDGLITNFHLPKSTLLMLVSAFAGRELIMEAYQEAITEQYRFFSFGDAMLIL